MEEEEAKPLNKLPSCTGDGKGAPEVGSALSRSKSTKAAAATPRSSSALLSRSWASTTVFFSFIVTIILCRVFIYGFNVDSNLATQDSNLGTHDSKIVHSAPYRIFRFCTLARPTIFAHLDATTVLSRDLTFHDRVILLRQSNNIIILLFLILFFLKFQVVFRSTLSSFFTTVTTSNSSSSLGKGVREYPLNCSRFSNVTNPQKCPISYPTTPIEPSSEYTTACPDYFRWIHEDLKPWRATGITREAIESRKSLAHFRLVVHKGKAYLEQFHRAWQTRDVFTLWGILQLLRTYPGRVPDLEMMFCCEDLPALPKVDNPVPDGAAPPAMFHYCGHDSAFDIPFPDWSFWGWPEVNIKPWSSTLKAIKQGAAKTEWKDRDPHAFWKGNPGVSPKRGDLMNCNPSKNMDWNARLYSVDWGHETSGGFKASRLEDQCTHRYKIYVEGRAWSVSEKYILACDAATLMVKPEYYDFFTRGMIPKEHYWPIRPDNMCRDIKFAVDWGNTHTVEAQMIGEEGTRFAQESVSMARVYDYMFHALTEYAKLQKFEVTVPSAPVELCSETMACPVEGQVKDYMIETLVRSPSTSLPCSMPPPYEPHELQEFMQRKQNITKQVEMSEAEYWEHINPNRTASKTERTHPNIFMFILFLFLLNY